MTEFSKKESDTIKQLEHTLSNLEKLIGKMNTLVNAFSAGGDVNDPFFVEKLISSLEETHEKDKR